jgi:hypothetical protein
VFFAATKAVLSIYSMTAQCPKRVLRLPDQLRRDFAFTGSILGFRSGLSKGSEVSLEVEISVSSRPSRASTLRTFLGEMDSRAATRDTFFRSCSQARGITRLANSSSN